MAGKRSARRDDGRQRVRRSASLRVQRHATNNRRCHEHCQALPNRVAVVVSRSRRLAEAFTLLHPPRPLRGSRSPKTAVVLYVDVASGVAGRCESLGKTRRGFDRGPPAKKKPAEKWQRLMGRKFRVVNENAIRRRVFDDEHAVTDLVRRHAQRSRDAVANVRITNRRDYSGAFALRTSQPTSG